jgi:hypothetical protein
MCFWSRADARFISQNNAGFLVNWSKCGKLTWLHGLRLPLIASRDFSRIGVPSWINSLSSSYSWTRTITRFPPSHQVCCSSRYLIASLLSPQNWNVARWTLRTRARPTGRSILTKIESVYIWHFVYWRNRFGFKLATVSCQLVSCLEAEEQT